MVYYSQRTASRIDGGMSAWMCESMCNKEQAQCKNDNFRLNTTGNYRFARLYLETQYMILTLADPQYYSRIFHVINKQLRGYTQSFPNVLPYVSSALTSVTYVEPSPNASKHIMYPHLFEEIATAV